MHIRPLNDLLVVQVYPPEQPSDIIIAPHVEDAPLRKGKVLRVGPGKYRLRAARESKKVFFQKVDLQPGDQVVFFAASAGTKKHRIPCYALGDDEAILHYDDVLFVFEEGVRVSL